MDNPEACAESYTHTHTYNNVSTYISCGAIPHTYCICTGKYHCVLCSQKLEYYKSQETSTLYYKEVQKLKQKLESKDAMILALNQEIAELKENISAMYVCTLVQSFYKIILLLTHTHTYIHVHTHMLTYIHTRKCTHTCTHTHTHTHTHIHTHTHTCTCTYSFRNIPVHVVQLQEEKANLEQTLKQLLESIKVFVNEVDQHKEQAQLNEKKILREKK